MSRTPAQEAIALLIDLAQRGEINPWDVQVIEVIDRYLSELATEPGRRDTDLSESGQAFLWASMLVLLKADTLVRLDEPEDPELTDEAEEFDAAVATRLPLHLERHLRRRRAAPPPKKRPVTLSELIEQLQQIAAQLDEAPVRSRSPRPRSQSRAQAAQAIAHLAHDENLTEIAARLEVFLCHHWHTIATGNDWLNLEQLLEWWSLLSTAPTEADSLTSPTLTSLENASSEQNNHPASHNGATVPDSVSALAGNSSAEDASLPQDEVRHEGEVGAEAIQHRAGDRVGIFWALLLLSAQSKVELSQEEFYQDLKIRALK